MGFMYKSMGAKHSNWHLSQNNQYVSYALLSLGALLTFNRPIWVVCFSCSLCALSSSKILRLISTINFYQYYYYFSVSEFLSSMFD